MKTAFLQLGLGALAGLVVLALPARAQCRRLNQVLGPGRDVVQYALTPDGQRVVYRADADRDQVFELYSVTADGLGTPVKLHAALPSGRTVFGFALDPTGTRVLYHANPTGSGKVELFSVPVDGSLSPIRLSPTLNVTNGGIQTIALFGELLYQATPDGTRAVFVAAVDIGSQADIYSAAIDGSAPAVRLNPVLGLVGDKSVSITSHFRISPDSTRVVYEADQDTGDVNELYSVPVDGSGPSVKLNGTLVAGGDVVTDALLVTADSSRVVYLADQDTDDVAELYSVPLSGGTAVRLNGVLPAGGEVLRDFALTPDGARVVFRADANTDGAVQLFSAPVDGSQPPSLVGGSGTAGRTVMHFRISPDGSRVAYAADEDALHEFRLYAAPTDGSAPATPLGGAFPPDADVQPGLLFTADGTRVLHLADGEENQRFDLFVVPADGSSAPLRLNPASADADVRAFHLTPDGSRVTFLADAFTDETPELLEVSLAGGSALRLCGLVPAGRQALSSFTALDDGALVLSDLRQADVTELFRVFLPRQVGHAAGSGAPGSMVTRSP